MNTRPLLPLLFVLAACASSQSTEPHVETEPTAYPVLARLNETISKEMEQSSIPGLSACIIKDNDVRWCGAFGMADLEEKRPVTVETPFLVASVSKLVSTISILHAVEEGQLNLDDPIASVLPFDVVHPDFPEIAITLRMLLTHQSGIFDNWSILQQTYTDGDPTFSMESFLEAYLVGGGAYFRRENFEGTPGASWDYSNVGAALAAYAVEAATGTSFAEYSKQHLIEPLGLAHTGWFLRDLDIFTLAMPYEWVGGQPRPVGHYGFPDYPSGQLRVSAPDLARIFRVLTSGGTIEGITFLEKDTVDEMARLQVEGNEEQGLMWFYSDRGGERFVGHDGAEQGAAAEVQMRVSDGVAVVLMMNGEADSAMVPLLEALFYAADNELP